MRQAKVAYLHQDQKPDAKRVNHIRHWHASQAVAPQEPVTLLAFTITFDGQINTKGLFIGPLQAELLLPELYRVIQRIEERLEAPTGSAPISRMG